MKRIALFVINVMGMNLHRTLVGLHGFLKDSASEPFLEAACQAKVVNMKVKTLSFHLH